MLSSAWDAANTGTSRTKPKLRVIFGAFLEAWLSKKDPGKSELSRRSGRSPLWWEPFPAWCGPHSTVSVCSWSLTRSQSWGRLQIPGNNPGCRRVSGLLYPGAATLCSLSPNWYSHWSNDLLILTLQVLSLVWDRWKDQSARLLQVRWATAPMSSFQPSYRNCIHTPNIPDPPPAIFSRVHTSF